MNQNRDRIIEHMAHAMKVYDESASEKTWRQLATAAYYAYINCVHGDVFDAPDIKAYK